MKIKLIYLVSIAFFTISIQTKISLSIYTTIKYLFISFIFNFGDVNKKWNQGTWVHRKLNPNRKSPNRVVYVLLLTHFPFCIT